MPENGVAIAQKRCKYSQLMFVVLGGGAHIYIYINTYIVISTFAFLGR